MTHITRDEKKPIRSGKRLETLMRSHCKLTDINFRVPDIVANSVRLQVTVDSIFPGFPVRFSYSLKRSIYFILIILICSHMTYSMLSYTICHHQE